METIVVFARWGFGSSFFPLRSLDPDPGQLHPDLQSYSDNCKLFFSFSVPSPSTFFFVDPEGYLIFRRFWAHITRQMQKDRGTIVKTVLIQKNLILNLAGQICQWKKIYNYHYIFFDRISISKKACILEHNYKKIKE